MTWDINRLKKIAGMPASEATQRLNESFDDDGDDDPDVKIAMSDKRQQKFEQKNKKELKTADAEASAVKKDKAATAKEEAPAKKEVAKVEHDKAEADKKPAGEDKKEEAAKAEAKRRGKAPNPESFNQHAKSNARNMSRGQFIKWAAETHGKGKNYASALFAKYNPKSSREVKTECWILVHPQMPSFVLAENRELNQTQWVDPTSSLDTLVYTSEAEAKKMQTYLAEWRGQASIVEHIDLSDAE